MDAAFKADNYYLGIFRAHKEGNIICWYQWCSKPQTNRQHSSKKGKKGEKNKYTQRLTLHWTISDVCNLI